MPNQSDDSFENQLPEDPEELVAEYRRAQGEINAIIDKQSEIHKAAGGRLVEIVDSEGISSWMPRVERQHLPLTDAEEIAMKALNKLEWELEEKRDYRSLIETKAAIRGCQLPDRRQLVLQVPESRETDEPNQPNSFRNEGDFWIVSFKGSKARRIKDSIGIQYVGYLVGHPAEKFRTPLDLERTVRGEAMEANPWYSEMTEGQLDQEGLSIKRPVYEKFDLETIKFLKTCDQALQDSDRDIQKASQDGDSAEVERLEKVKRETRKQVAERSRQARRGWDEVNEKARKRIRNAIQRSIEHIDKHDADLAAHLRKNLLRFRFPYSYEPDPPIDWTT